jgi:uncharacterized protein
VLSPHGVPTALAATRLLPPDSLMAPLDEVEFRGRVATSSFLAKYGVTVDRDSAYERITARLAAARAAAFAAVSPGGVRPLPGTSMSPLTPTQQERESARQAREIAAQQRAADRQRAAETKAQHDAARAQQRTINTAIRTGGRLVTSRVGQDMIRGIFGTLFGGGKSR